jgi:hypothetical protein
VSEGEIAADLLVIEPMRFLGPLAPLFDRDRIKIREKGFARLAYGRIDDPFQQLGVCAQIFRIGGESPAY